MLYGEQRYQPERNIVAAAWTVRNRITTGYGGGAWPTYKAQVENGQYHGVITPEERDALTGGDKEHFEYLKVLAEEVIRGSRSDPMAITDAIFFTNTYYPAQTELYETLLNNPEGPVGSGYWGKFAGGGGEGAEWFYFYRNKPGIYPEHIDLPWP
jgi:hypothetical protein